ncbi:MAG: Hpt domain-containing protein [Planctomycetota bacterium]
MSETASVSELAPPQPVRSLFADDEDFRELIELFLSSATERIDEMPRMFAENDLAALRVAAHQLKGSAGGYGFPGLTDLAAELEARCIDGVTTEADVTRVTDYLRRLTA